MPALLAAMAIWGAMRYTNVVFAEDEAIFKSMVDASGGENLAGEDVYTSAVANAPEREAQAGGRLGRHRPAVALAVGPQVEGHQRP